jgi:hypothetical protein
MSSMTFCSASISETSKVSFARASSSVLQEGPGKFPGKETIVYIRILSFRASRRRRDDARVALGVPGARRL